MPDYHPEQIFQTRGVELCTDAFGKRSDPAILLIMGASASMLLWEEAFCQQLAANNRFVMRFDNRDVGKSSCCPVGAPDYSMQDMAVDATAVLDHYGIDQAHIVGASMGGMITQLLGLNHPERVLSLVPIMSSPNPGAVTDAMEGRTTRQVLSPPSEGVLAAAMAGSNLDWNDRDAVLANRLAMFRASCGTAYAFDEPSRRTLYGREIDRARNSASSQNHALVVGLTERWHERLGEISHPTLVIHGTEDPILPIDHGEAIAHAVPGARLLRLPGVGHELPAEEYATVIPALIEFTS